MHKYLIMPFYLKNILKFHLSDRILKSADFLYANITCFCTAMFVSTLEKYITIFAMKTTSKKRF